MPAGAESTSAVQQLAGVVDAFLPSFPQEGAVWIDLAGRRVLPFVRLRRVQQMFAHGLVVEVEFIGNPRHTPPLLLQIAYVHKILQVEHWAPWSAQRFHTWGLFDRHYWGIFNRRFWGILDLALTDFISGRPFFHLSTLSLPPFHAISH
jgi:hypothetical protein